LIEQAIGNIDRKVTSLTIIAVKRKKEKTVLFIEVKYGTQTTQSEKRSKCVKWL